MIEGNENPQELQMNFGERLRKAMEYYDSKLRERAAAGGRPFKPVQQKDIAAAGGIGAGTVSGWFKSPPSDPRSAAVNKIARFLGVSPLWLSTERGPMIAPDQPEPQGMIEPASAEERAESAPDARRIIAIMEAAAEALHSMGELPGDRKLVEIACDLYPLYPEVTDAARAEIVKTLTAALKALR